MPELWLWKCCTTIPPMWPRAKPWDTSPIVRMKFDESKKWSQEAIKLDPNNFAAHYWFAAASIRKGAPDKATQAAIEESLRTAIKLNPSFAPAYDALAMFFAERATNLVEAHDLIDKAVQLGPAVPELRVDQAQVLSIMNKDQQAIEVLDMALKMSHTPEQTAAVSNVLQSLQNSLPRKRRFTARTTSCCSIRALLPAAPPPDNLLRDDPPPKLDRRPSTLRKSSTPTRRAAPSSREPASYRSSWASTAR